MNSKSIIKHNCTKYNISEVKLAKRLGVSVSEFEAWENGKAIPGDKLNKWLKRQGVIGDCGYMLSVYSNSKMITDLLRWLDRLFYSKEDIDKLKKEYLYSKNVLIQISGALIGLLETNENSLSYNQIISHFEKYYSKLDIAHALAYLSNGQYIECDDFVYSCNRVGVEK